MTNLLPVEPWWLREPEFDLGRMGKTESLFALSNGHIGLRGNLDESEPNDKPGTFLSGSYEGHPCRIPKVAMGDSESGQTIINVTSGKLIRLLVDAEPFDVRTGLLLHHGRVLDLRAGTLLRSVEWISPAGRTVRIRSTLRQGSLWRKRRLEGLRMTTVDGHLHVFAARSDRYPRDVEELFPPEMEAPVEGLLAVMDAAGVDHAVLVPLSPHDEYLRECLRRFPGRFAGIGVHDSAARDPVGELRRRVAATGIQGLRVGWLGSPDMVSPEALDTFPLLAALADDGLKLWFYSPPDQLPLLGGVLEALPHLQVVLNHLGFCPTGYVVDEWGRPHIDTELPPATLPTVLSLARFPTVHVMVSGQYAFSREPYPYRDLEPVVQAIYQAYGADRLLWASDYPWIAKVPGYAAQVALVDELLPDLTPLERAAVMGGTAQRLLWFSPSPQTVT